MHVAGDVLHSRTITTYIVIVGREKKGPVWGLVVLAASTLSLSGMHTTAQSAVQNFVSAVSIRSSK